MEIHTSKRRRRRRRRRSVATDFDFNFKSSSQQIASSIQTTQLATDLYLPDDCWEYIFKIIFSNGHGYGRCYFKSLSLSIVSKQFLSVSDRLIFSLRILDSTRPFLPRLFQRFTNLISLDLSSFYGEINALLCEISRFPLRLMSLKLFHNPTIPADGLRVFSQNITTLTSLTCSELQSINATGLLLIADCFPLLEELDLRYSQKIKLANCESLRNGLMTLSLTLCKLRKVNLTGHHYINDQLLFHLFRNWKLLEDANIFNCYEITNAGIASALRERPTLKSLSFSNHFKPMDPAALIIALAALVSNSPSLSEINLQHTRIKRIENSNHLNVICPQLKSLCVANNRGLSDESIQIIVSLFPNLQFLNLSYCKNISEKAICQILKRCCKIRHLDLTGSKWKLLGLNFEVPKLEVLNLSRTRVDDETLYAISKSCRGLTQLLLKFCDVTKKGVKHVVENCTQLREINLRGCSNIDANVVASMAFSRPLLRKITPPNCPLASCQRLHW